MTKKVLVIGANGFLGNKVLLQCIDRGWQTDAVYHSDKNRIPPSCRAFTDRHLPAEAYDYIFNLAAFIPYGAYNEANPALIKSNIELPLLLNRHYPAGKIIFASSVSVYGAATGVISERSAVSAPTQYGLSKLAGELIVSHHASWSALRFSSIYGKGMYAGTFLPKIAANAKQHGQIALLGKGERQQDYIHVNDAATLCIHAALYGQNEVYLGVNGTAYSNKEVAETMAALIPGTQVSYNGADNSPSFIYDNTHTRNSLQFAPAMSLEAGLKTIIHE